MARTPVIKTSGLEKTFDLGAVKVTALSGVNLEIYSGEFIVFFGPSGCGKSTLMSMIAGLQPPSGGKIWIRGENLGEYNENQLAEYRRTKIGMVFQAFNLITSMNIVENIALPLSFARIPRKRRINRAENLLETVAMSDYKHHTPSELSGGQQQRIALARSLVANPWIVLADEPTGNLDSKSANDVMRLLIKLNRKSKRTVILITHNPEYLVYADRVFRLKDGKVVDVEVNSDAKTEIVPETKKDEGKENKKKGKRGKKKEQEEQEEADTIPESSPPLDDTDTPLDVTSDFDETEEKSKEKKDKKKKAKMKPMRIGE
ncbi:MAG: ABC transporter ATP-binding protein [Patescibacteria group bacterium]|nr:ABC transporter ATP-binding protein [Patescibacteria group bacterium]